MKRICFNKKKESVFFFLSFFLEMEDRVNAFLNIADVEEAMKLLLSSSSGDKQNEEEEEEIPWDQIMMALVRKGAVQKLQRVLACTKDGFAPIRPFIEACILNKPGMARMFTDHHEMMANHLDRFSEAIWGLIYYYGNYRHGPSWPYNREAGILAWSILCNRSKAPYMSKEMAQRIMNWAKTHDDYTIMKIFYESPSIQ